MSLGRHRRDDNADSIEKGSRETLPPPGGGFLRPNTTVREGAGRARSVGCYRHNDDDYCARPREPGCIRGDT